MMLFLLFLIACLAYVIFAVFVVRTESRRAKPTGDVDLHPSVKFLLGGGLSVIIGMTMAYLFLIKGAAPTVQFNAGSDSRMNAWSLWVDLWPVFLPASFANGLGNVVWLVVCIVMKSGRRLIPVAVASSFLSILSFLTVVACFPSA